MFKVGAHVSAAKSIDLSIDRAKEIQAETIQIFISPPQQWYQPLHSSEKIISFNSKAKDANISFNFIHGVYLINLGEPNPELLQKSIDWLIHSLHIAEKLNINGTIFHLGSHRKNGFDSVFETVLKSIEAILSKTPLNTQLILENSAGMGGGIGCSFEELGRIVKTIADPRLKICLDTQHSFAYGYNWNDLHTTENALGEFDNFIGLKNLSVLHVNDSKTFCGSKVDRHENLGEGKIGLEGIRNLLKELLKSERDRIIPLIIETPGFENKGPDLKNVLILKQLIDNL